MELTGEEKIAQSIEKVWDALNDPQVLKACIPGCEDIVKVGDSEYKIVLLTAIGPVRARFNGKLLLSDMHPPTSYSLTFEGAGGAAGFAKGSAQVTLSSEETFTKLVYKAEAKVGGKIAQVGSRLIDGVASKTAADFFKRFNQTVAPVPAPGPAVVSDAAAAGERPVKPAKYPPLPTSWWIVLLVVVFAVGFYFCF
jgi:carbon monoxide dehydrogenase subunit G